MAKQHIVDGEVRPCRARVKKCPKSDTHFDSKEEAQKWVEEEYALEEKIAKAMGKKRRNPPTPQGKRALTAKLGGHPKQTWMDDPEQFSSQAEVVDIIDGEGEKLAVVWDPEDQSRNAATVRSRGYNQLTVSYRSLETGEMRGYFRISTRDEEVMKYAFGDDEWSAFRYVENFDGSVHGGLLDYSVDVGARESEMKADRWVNAKSDEERAALKRRIWVSYTKAFNAKDGFTPSNWDEIQPKLTWGSAINLTEEHAPQNEEELDRDLAALRERCEGYREKQYNATKHAFVDYIEVNDAYRGKGYGQGLYAYGARLMGERKNSPVSASGLQSDEAQRAWDRMLMTSGFKITKGERTNTRGEPSSSVMQLDFRK